MKKSVLLLLALLLLSFTAVSAAGEDHKDSAAKNNYESIEANYLAGLKSDNCGLRNSSAYFLGEIKSQKAVIPLMKILRNDKMECLRIYAALALVKIGDERGVFLVKQTAVFDDSERIANLCDKFYRAYCCNKVNLNDSSSYILYAAKIK